MNIKVDIGIKFMDSQRMEVVRKHETLLNNWWCRGLDNEVGLWAYNTDFIIKNYIKNGN